MNKMLAASAQSSLAQPQVSLQRLTSFRVGGRAEWLAMPHSLDHLHELVAWAQHLELPITPLGAGSNLLISDSGIAGLVICTRRWRFSHFDQERGQVTVASGEPLPTLAWKTAKQGWRGLEWAVGIPGTVGGAVVMNAGAHGACVADSLVSVTVLDPDQGIITLNPQDLSYAYRTSSLQGSHRLVVEATFQLTPGHDPAQVVADTLTDLNQRRSTQPYDKPSCGSVFRNPLPHSAGWLIEQTGLKGYRIGNAQVAHRHANFILNCGGATAADIYRLICHIQEQVQTQWSLDLRPEVRMLGEFSAG